jgi:hypothetical protein
VGRPATARLMRLLRACELAQRSDGYATRAIPASPAASPLLLWRTRLLDAARLRPGSLRSALQRGAVPAFGGAS